jgi:hypothetical protein
VTFEPELRPGPPWVMEEMIWSQPDLPERIAGSDDADRLAAYCAKRSTRARRCSSSRRPGPPSEERAGTNPDRIRREQPLYRKVAEAGGAG